MAAQPSSPAALFERDGDRFIPSVLTTGPWQPDAMHGGPPAALIGRLAEQHCHDDEWVARLTIELERPVPLEALTAVATRRDVSRRVAHVDMTLRVETNVVVSARALVLRHGSLPAPAWQESPSPADVLDSSAIVDVPSWASGDMPFTYHQHAVEHRMPPGSSFSSPGPATSWIRLRYPLVAGEDTSGLSRVLAAADFGSGISAIYRSVDRVGLINADLNVALRRIPADEWVRIDATTSLDPSGTALCLTHLSDRAGPLGVATQSLLGLRL